MFNNIKVDFNMGYIYLRKNKVNGKCYVGQTDNIKRRNRNWNNLKKKYAGKVINNARAKYGTDGFSFEILKECEDEELNQWEMYYVKMYNSKKPYGYNSTDGGDSIYEMTDETKEKIADTLRGRKLTPETKKKIGDTMRGRKRPDLSVVNKNNPKKSKAVQALDKDGNVVYEFPSTMEAQRHGFIQSAVSTCCRNCYNRHGNNIYKGFIWRYKENAQE